MEMTHVTLTDRLTSEVLDAQVRTGVDWNAVAVAWLVEVGQRTGSKRTPIEYGRYVGRFLSGHANPALATPIDIHAFAYGIGPSGKQPGPAAIIVRLAALRGYYDFCRRMGYLNRNPALDVKTPRLNEPVPKGLTAAQIRFLLAAIPNNESGVRDRAIILTAVLTGLRRAEVLGLRRGDIVIDPLSGRTMYKVRAKGGQIRHRELPPPAMEAILLSMEAHGRQWDDIAAAESLWAVSPGAFAANLRRYALRAGLVGVTPHVLRHSAAKLRRETGASIEDVGALLGHQSLYTTARYLARLEGQVDDGWLGAAVLLDIA